MTGVVKFFDSKRGWGFIISDENEMEVYVHYSEILMDGFKRLFPGDKVKFELGEHNGRVCATEVVKL